MARTQVFISYAHADWRWRDRVVTHLRVIAKARLIDLWDDRNIGVSEDWYTQINEKMGQARIAVLLVSSNFLGSDFILKKEVPTLFRRHETRGMKIYPLVIRPCPWREVRWLARMQVRPDGKAVSRFSDDKIDEILTAVAVEIAAMARVRAAQKPRRPAAKKVRKRAPTVARRRTGKNVRTRTPPKAAKRASTKTSATRALKRPSRRARPK